LSREINNQDHRIANVIGTFLFSSVNLKIREPALKSNRYTQVGHHSYFVV